MVDTLNILAPIRYPWRFNGPRSSRHNIDLRLFIPFNKVSSKIEGFTFFNPLPLKHFDLIHAFNRIPISSTPFIIGFESHLPRAFGYERSALYRGMTTKLLDKKCKAIIAISDYARRQFLTQHSCHPKLDQLESKLSIRYPNFPVTEMHDSFEWHQHEDCIKLVFIGNHFGRKGGSIAVRIAELASKLGKNIRVDIISKLEMGNVSWVTPTRKSYWNNDIRLLHSLPNVRLYSHLPNSSVLDIVHNAHFVLLPTFSDSFGYSAIEAMACGTPVVATRQCSLPEFIEDGKNGILLDLTTNEAGEWQQIGRKDRWTSDYEALFDEEVTKLTQEAFRRIEEHLKVPSSYLSMRKQARLDAEKMFSAADANVFWDNYYTKVLSE
jgi:glycosyltransferase involved in cell wall biosynthesis